MKSAEDGPCNDVTEPLDRAKKRRILVQGQVCTAPVVIRGVGSKDPAQVPFAEDHDVIEAFAADRADQPLHMPVLPG